MRWLILVLAAQAGAGSAAPPTDRADRVVGIWVGVAKVTQRGECSMNGQRVYSRAAVLAIRRESDGTLRAGEIPVGRERHFELRSKAEVTGENELVVLLQKKVTCGGATRTIVETLTADLPAPDAAPRRLRLTGISRTCPERGCIFENAFDMVWQSPMPGVANAPK